MSSRLTVAIAITFAVVVLTALSVWGLRDVVKDLERAIVSRFRSEGLSDAEINTLLIDNPKRLLPFAAPQG